MKIITGYKAEPHITSQQDRNVNMGIFGTGAYITNLGSKLAATVVSANEITIADGLLVAEGCTAEVERGTSESMEIANGSQGMRRIDLIVARYTREAGTGVEDMQLAVITGTPAASNPATPSYNTGSIANGDTLVDFPLYTVNLNGISIESVTRNVSYIELATSSALSSARTALQNSINSLSSTLSTVSSRVGTATLNTTAKNAMAAINELLTRINTLTTNLGTTNSNLSTTNSNLSTTNANLNTQKGRIDTLVSKTSGLVSFDTSNVAANSNGYRQLTALGMYLVLVNAATVSNVVRGMYLVGVTTGNQLGIKVISTANNVTLSDAGNGLLKIANTSSITVRLTIIRVY